MPSNRVSLGEAMAVLPLGGARYASDFPPQYSNGQAAHGGLVASLFTQTARVDLEHRGTLTDSSQLLRLHVEYLRPVRAGHKGVFTVESVRQGSLTSLVHIDLQQEDRSCARAYVSYIHQAAQAVVATGGSAAALKTSIERETLPREGYGSSLSDPRWVRCRIAHDPYSRVRTNFDFFLRRDTAWSSPMVEHWITPRGDADRFTTETLGMVADLWPQLADSYTGSPYSAAGMVQQALALEAGARGEKGGASRDQGVSMTAEDVGRWVTAWYPTVTLDLHIARALPGDGVVWLWQRAWTEQITTQGMDVQLRIADEKGDLVATGSLAVMVVDPARNGGRSKKL